MKNIPDYIKDLPGVRTGIFIFSVILSGILCSGFITEITINGKLEWSNFYKAITFWILSGYFIILYLYNRFFYRHENDTLKFLDENYCRAYIIAHCLPELVEKYNQELRAGKSPSDLIDIVEELKKMKK